MKIYLNPDGTWRIEDALEGVERHEDLPEVVKRILNLAVIMLPYGEVYLVLKELGAENTILKLIGEDRSTFNFNIHTGWGGEKQYVYHLEFDNDTVRNYYRTQENEPN